MHVHVGISWLNSGDVHYLWMLPVAVSQLPGNIAVCTGAIQKTSAECRRVLWRVKGGYASSLLVCVYVSYWTGITYCSYASVTDHALHRGQTLSLFFAWYLWFLSDYLPSGTCRPGTEGRVKHTALWGKDNGIRAHCASAEFRSLICLNVIILAIIPQRYMCLQFSFALLQLSQSFAICSPNMFLTFCLI